jgi:hypothetical protein
MSFTIPTHSYFTTASQPCENAIYNKENTLDITDYRMNGVTFNGINLGLCVLNNIYDGDKYIGKEFIYDNSDDNPEVNELYLWETIRIMEYVDKPTEIEIYVIFESIDYNTQECFYFEPEGMKSDDLFFPKGDCMNNYKLIITHNLDEEEDEESEDEE